MKETDIWSHVPEKKSRVIVERRGELGEVKKWSELTPAEWHGVCKRIGFSLLAAMQAIGVSSLITGKDVADYMPEFMTEPVLRMPNDVMVMKSEDENGGVNIRISQTLEDHLDEQLKVLHFKMEWPEENLVIEYELPDRHSAKPKN